MNTSKGNNQSGQGSKIDNGKNQNAIHNIKTDEEAEIKQGIAEAEKDDDFLSGDNEKKT
jgi:hypothetical protein